MFLRYPLYGVHSYVLYCTTSAVASQPPPRRPPRSTTSPPTTILFQGLHCHSIQCSRSRSNQSVSPCWKWRPIHQPTKPSAHPSSRITTSSSCLLHGIILEEVHTEYCSPPHHHRQYCTEHYSNSTLPSTYLQGSESTTYHDHGGRQTAIFCNCSICRSIRSKHPTPNGLNNTNNIASTWKFPSTTSNTSSSTKPYRPSRERTLPIYSNPARLGSRQHYIHHPPGRGTKQPAIPPIQTRPNQRNHQHLRAVRNSLSDATVSRRIESGRIRSRVGSQWEYYRVRWSL